MLRAGSYFIPTLLAIALHVVVVGLLAQSWFEHGDTVRKVPRHVQAQIVDMKSKKAQKKAAAEAKARKKAEKRRLADAEKKRKAEAKRKQDLAKKQAAEKKRKQEAAKKAARKKAAEKKRQEQLARKKAEQARIQKAKAEAEKKRKAEAAKKAAEAKRQRDAKKKAAAAREEAARQARNEAIQREIEAEEAAMQAERERAAVVSYEAYIGNEITHRWRRSPSARNGMEVEITIHLLPSGRVNDRYVSKSSGDSRFDNDALRAIDRVQVFEKLQEMDPVLFDRHFRKRILRFRPEDLRN